MKFSWVGLYGGPVSGKDHELCEQAVKTGYATRNDGNTEFIYKEERPNHITVYLNGRGRCKSIEIERNECECHPSSKKVIGSSVIWCSKCKKHYQR